MILNLTLHPATHEQRAAGVVDLDGPRLERLRSILTFDACPMDTDVARASILIVEIVWDWAEHDRPVAGSLRAMIGGPIFLVPALSSRLVLYGVQPVCAFLVHRSVELIQPDGSIQKVDVLRHAGFVSIPR